MIANLGRVERGRGGLVWSVAEKSAGGSGLSPAEAAAEALAQLGAAEAVQTLELANAAVEMPSVETATFPGPIAEALYWSDADVVGIVGPVGSGKTTTTLKSRLRRAIMMPRSVIDGTRRYKLLVVRETYRQLWATTIPSYLESYPKGMGSWSGGRGDPVTHVIQFDDGNGPIEFRVEFMAFGDDVIASMRGVQTTDIWLNETDTVPVEVLTAGIGRIDRWPGAAHFEGYPPELRGYGQIICDFNAPDEDNWTYRVFYDEEERLRMGADLSAGLPEGAKRISIAFYSQPGFGEAGCENLANLSASYYPRQIAANRLAGRGDMIDRLVYNKTVYLRAGDPVFRREFNRRIHVSDVRLEAVRRRPLRIGLDQGFKGAAVIADFEEPFHWRVLGELHFPNERLMAAEFGRRLAKLLDTRWPGVEVEAAWGDMAGEQGASQAADENATWNKLVAQAAGFRIRPQKIGTNRIQPRLEAVRAPLEYLDGGRPGLIIDPSAKLLIRGFEARYVWKDEVDQNGDKRKVPDKSLTEANVMDALQYLLLSEHRASGVSPISFPQGKGDRMGLPGLGKRGGMMPQGPAGGLETGFDVLNPY